MTSWKKHGLAAAVLLGAMLSAAIRERFASDLQRRPNYWGRRSPVSVKRTGQPVF